MGRKRQRARDSPIGPEEARCPIVSCLWSGHVAGNYGQYVGPDSGLQPTDSKKLRSSVIQPERN